MNNKNHQSNKSFYSNIGVKNTNENTIYSLTHFDFKKIPKVIMYNIFDFTGSLPHEIHILFNDYSEIYKSDLSEAKNKKIRTMILEIKCHLNNFKKSKDKKDCNLQTLKDIQKISNFDNLYT